MLAIRTQRLTAPAERAEAATLGQDDVVVLNSDLDVVAFPDVEAAA